MSDYEQLELFPLTECEKLRDDLNKIKKELANVRRGIFTRHNEILKLIVEQRVEIDQLKLQLEPKIKEA